MGAWLFFLGSISVLFFFYNKVLSKLSSNVSNINGNSTIIINHNGKKVICRKDETVTVGDMTVTLTNCFADITVNGNVNGNVSTTNGNIKCSNVSGDVSTTNGDVECQTIYNGAYTTNGDITVAKHIYNHKDSSYTYNN